MGKKRAIIIHGWAGTAGSGWKGWLQRKLKEGGWEVHAPQMPNAEKPKMGEWLEEIRKAAGNPDESCFFVGHSLGCVAALRYIEALGESERIGGAVLVAGFSDDLGIPEIKDFFPRPFDWAKIRGHCAHFTAIHSDNDRYVALRYGDEFEKKLGAKLIVMRNKGHFSTSEGMRELPSALKALLLLAGEERKE